MKQNCNFTARVRNVSMCNYKEISFLLNSNAIQTELSHHIFFKVWTSERLILPWTRDPKTFLWTWKIRQLHSELLTIFMKNICTCYWNLYCNIWSVLISQVPSILSHGKHGPLIFRTDSVIKLQPLIILQCNSFSFPEL